MKICTRCGEEKSKDCFSKRTSSGQPSLRAQCRKCEYAVIKVRRQKPEVKKRNAETEKIRHTKNPEKRKGYSKTYRARHLEECREKDRLWSKSNPEKRREKARRRRLKYPEQTRITKRNFFRKKYQTDPAYRLYKNTKRVMQASLKKQGCRKSAKTSILLGCSTSEFWKRMEKLLWPGMSFRNRHKWQIDHIRPCADFDLSDPEQQKACFHYANYQPLWADDNQIKSDRLDWTPHESRHSVPERLKPAPFIFIPQ